MTAQVSEVTRVAVWSELLVAARLARYHGQLAARHSRYANWTKVLLAIAGTGAAAGLLDFMPVLLVEIAGALAAALIIWELTQRQSEKAARFSLISERLNHLETALRNLWEDVQSQGIDTDEARHRLTALRTEIDDLTARFSDLTTDDELNERCAKEAYEVESNRYAI